jgi:tripartite-type tricarboxylate transporter receptor subunit TctC
MASVRTTIAVLFIAAAGIGSEAGAQAVASDAYPERPIRLIVPFPAGGINDVLARAWAEKIRPHLGLVVVENRGGGGSMIGAAEASRAAADGYTLLLGNSTNQVLNPQLMRKPPFDPARDFLAVTILTKIPNVVVAHPSLPVHNLKELAAHAQANPGKLNYGSAGVGSMTHLSGELFKKSAGGLDMVHVPYRGGAPLMTDLIGGTLPVASLSMAAQLHALHRAGKVRILAINATQRVGIAPDIPTAAESGFPDMVVEVFNAIFVPAGTPRAIADRIAEATRKIMTDPDLQKVLRGAGAEIVTDSDVVQATQFVNAERARWKPIIDGLGIEQR